METPHQEVDLVVLGAGIIGVLTALEASQRGLTVALLERHPGLFRGTTAAGFGSLTPFSDPFFAGAARDLAVRGVRLYREQLLPRLDSLGTPVELCDKGLIEILDTPEQLRAAHKLIEDLQSAGYGDEAELLDRDSALALEPNLARDFDDALLLNEPWLDTEQLFRALTAEVERAATLTLQTSAEVDRIEQKGDKWVINTTSGAAVTAPWLVISTGVTAAFPFGVPSPVLECIRGDAVEVTAPDGKARLQRHIYRFPGFITPRTDGRLWLGATYEIESTPPDELQRSDQINITQLLALLEQNVRILPTLHEMEIVRVWRGWRAGTIDGFPILGRGKQPGVLYAAGCKGLGLTMAPAIADALITGLVTNDWSKVPDQFDPCRDGVIEAD